MTKEEALVKISPIIIARTELLDALEALGLIKFDEPVVNTILYQITQKYDVIKVEEWQEGLVIWVGGQIVYRSWENKADNKL